jgi:hypothetical protein
MHGECRKFCPGEIPCRGRSAQMFDAKSKFALRCRLVVAALLGCSVLRSERQRD